MKSPIQSHPNVVSAAQDACSSLSVDKVRSSKSKLCRSVGGVLLACFGLGSLSPDQTALAAPPTAKPAHARAFHEMVADSRELTIPHTYQGDKCVLTFNIAKPQNGYSWWLVEGLDVVLLPKTKTILQGDYYDAMIYEAKGPNLTEMTTPESDYIKRSFQVKIKAGLADSSPVKAAINPNILSDRLLNDPWYQPGLLANFVTDAPVEKINDGKIFAAYLPMSHWSREESLKRLVTHYDKGLIPESEYGKELRWGYSLPGTTPGMKRDGTEEEVRASSDKEPLSGIIGGQMIEYLGLVPGSPQEFWVYDQFKERQTKDYEVIVIGEYGGECMLHTGQFRDDESRLDPLSKKVLGKLASKETARAGIRHFTNVFPKKGHPKGTTLGDQIDANVRFYPHLPHNIINDAYSAIWALMVDKKAQEGTPRKAMLFYWADYESTGLAVTKATPTEVQTTNPEGTLWRYEHPTAPDSVSTGVAFWACWFADGVVTWNQFGSGGLTTDVNRQNNNTTDHQANQWRPKVKGQSPDPLYAKKPDTRNPVYPETPQDYTDQVYIGRRMHNRCAVQGAPNVFCEFRVKEAGGNYSGWIKPHATDELAYACARMDSKYAEKKGLPEHGPHLSWFWSCRTQGNKVTFAGQNLAAPVDKRYTVQVKHPATGKIYTISDDPAHTVAHEKVTVIGRNVQVFNAQVK